MTARGGATSLRDCGVTLSRRPSGAAEAFAQSAASYCRLIDSMRNSKPGALYSRLETLLSELHRGILPVTLPDTEGPDVTGWRPMSNSQAAGVARAVRNLVHQDCAALIKRCGGTELGPGSLEVWETTRIDMLWDDLVDVHRELHDGLVLWNLAGPDARRDAVWRWRFGYESHWGEHLFHAMWTVHEIRYRLCRD